MRLGPSVHGSFSFLIERGVPAERIFLVDDLGRERFAKAAVALIATGVLLLAALHHMQSPFNTLLPAVLIGAGVLSFLLQARAFYAKRHRPALDPGMRLAACALAVIAVALLMVWPVLLRDAVPHFAVAYVMCAVLGISLFVAAHYYKIVPFLIWFHRYGNVASRSPGEM